MLIIFMPTQMDCGKKLGNYGHYRNTRGRSDERNGFSLDSVGK